MKILKYILEKNKLIVFVNNGLMFVEHPIVHEIEDIQSEFNVVCNHCNKIYDLRKVKVTQRYSDCDDFTTPCCGYEHADNRFENILHGNHTHYTILTKYLQLK